ncbi:MAG: murein biosynthesis integral membrane protein MurJ [Phycisphaerae bacterium]|nr:murein biosynthesis integral membrane protein MurJ [Phycisphaerae bacterium]
MSAARVVSGLTLVSRFLGLVRDAVFAAAFGAGWAASAFTLAFMIPNLFRRLFGEGALSSAFIPVFTEVHRQGDARRASRLAGTVLVATALLLAILVVLGEGIVAGMGLFVDETPRNEAALQLTHIMLPYAVLICGVALMSGLLNVLGHFAAPAAAPIVLNVCIISAVGVGSYVGGLGVETRLTWVAIAVVIAGFLQSGLQWLAVRARGFRIELSLDLRDEAVRRIAVLTGPMVLGLGAVQLNTLADGAIAWLFVPHAGAVMKLYLAQRLYQFPLGVFLIALSTAIYPQFSRMAADRDMDGFGESVVRGLRMALFIGLPASMGLILMREPLVGLLFERGKFVGADTARTASILLYYAGGIWAYGLQMMLARGFYALQDSKTPVRIALLMVALNLTLNLIFVHVLPEPQERGLALATAICAAIQSGWLALLLARRVGRVAWRELAVQAVRVVVATVIMSIACAVVMRWLSPKPSIQVLGVLVAGLGSFAVASWLMRIDELRDLVHLRRG